MVVIGASWVRGKASRTSPIFLECDREARVERPRELPRHLPDAEQALEAIVALDASDSVPADRVSKLPGSHSPGLRSVKGPTRAGEHMKAMPLDAMG